MKIIQPRAIAITPDGAGVIIADASNTIRIISSSGSGKYDVETKSFTQCHICPEGTVSKAPGSSQCEEVKPIYRPTFKVCESIQIT